MTPTLWIAVVIASGLGALVVLLLVYRDINLWVQAWTSGVPVTVYDLIGMRLRKTDPRVIIDNRIRAAKAGIHLSLPQLESHALAGGRVPVVVSALIAARQANVALSWDDATRIDLVGNDPLAAVRSAPGVE